MKSTTENPSNDPSEAATRQDTSFVAARTFWPRVGKRVFDCFLATLGLVVTAPLLALAALAVKLTTRGPVFFTQTRVGRDERLFRILKLRTLAASHTPDPHEIIDDDHPAHTLLGRWLRRTRIDELPQWLNVLAGHMSVIGPRPILPEHAARYDAFERRRLLVRPGLTGLAQVHGNTAIEWDERIRFDVYYVAQCSFRLDMWILWRTLLVFLLGQRRFARRFDEAYPRMTQH